MPSGKNTRELTEHISVKMLDWVVISEWHHGQQGECSVNFQPETTTRLYYPPYSVIALYYFFFDTFYYFSHTPSIIIITFFLCALTVFKSLI